MANNVLKSIDNMLVSQAAYGELRRTMFWYYASSGAVANSTSGYVSALRLPQTFTVPAYGAGISTSYMTYFRAAASPTSTGIFAAIEIPLGTITLNGNSFVSGSSMPSRTIFGGSAQQTASIIPMLYVSTSGTAAAPTITTTYTNQGGTTGQSMSLTLPTTPVANSAFFMGSSLASGDTGIRAVTNMSSSVTTGTAVYKVVGLLPLAITTAISGGSTPVNPISSPQIMWGINAGDTISFWRYGSTLNGAGSVSFCLLADS